MIRRSSFQILDRMKRRFDLLYGKEKTNNCLERVSMLTGRYGIGLYGQDGYRYWDQADIFLIAYADILSRPDEKPIRTLHQFLNAHLKGAVNHVHLLPFFPYSSDDGFSVIDYRRVDPDIGSWTDIENLSKDFSLMFDLVLNHVSSRSHWFKHFSQNIAPERNYFIETDRSVDLNTVVRPRLQPLLTEFKTKTGPKHLWTTFSSDQIDLNFANPDVLFEFLDILMEYISHGARVIRLDAIAYLWKKLGTPCIHLKETHEIVKLIRDFLEMVAPQVLIMTETNVPHSENISYFGEGDESQIVYQFSLPPLLLHALINEDAGRLSDWAGNIEPPPAGCTFLNFTASHDGIGVRPLEGLVPEEEIDALAVHAERRGGRVSRKSNPDGTESPYELNISYYNALGGAPDDPLHEARFLCSQAVALALRGIPAVYFHSLTATPNHLAGVAHTGRARSINRRKWNLSELEGLLADESGAARRVFNEYIRLLRLRAQIRAFHPDGAQEVFAGDPRFFAVLRSSPDGSEQVLAVSNFTGKRIIFEIPTQAMKFRGTETVFDRIGDRKLTDTGNVPFEPFQTRWIMLAQTAN